MQYGEGSAHRLRGNMMQRREFFAAGGQTLIFTLAAERQGRLGLVLYLYSSHRKIREMGLSNGSRP